MHVMLNKKKSVDSNLKLAQDGVFLSLMAFCLCFHLGGCSYWEHQLDGVIFVFLKCSKDVLLPVCDNLANFGHISFAFSSGRCFFVQLFAAVTSV